MGVAVMAKRQQQNFDVDGREALRPSGRADQERLGLVGDAGEDVARLFPVLFAPELEKRRAAQFPEEERVRPRADDAHGKCASRVELEDERVGENAANGAWIDIVALRRAAGAAQFVPIGVELLTGGQFHCGPPSTPRGVCAKTARREPSFRECTGCLQAACQPGLEAPRRGPVGR